MITIKDNIKVHSLNVIHVHWTINANTPGRSWPGDDGNDRGTPNSPKIQHYWSLMNGFFSAVSRYPVGVDLPLSSDAVDVFYSPSRLGHRYIPPIDGTIAGITTLGPEGYENEELIHISQIYRTTASPSDAR